MTLRDLYATLRQQFGERADPDVWWPIYYGRAEPPQFERVITTILVSRAQWTTVKSVVTTLDTQSLLTARALADAPEDVIALCIRPTGFQVDKARTLGGIGVFITRAFGTEAAFCAQVTRDQLLQLHGIGDETADRILLYACGRLAWPVDTYCLRVLVHYGIIAHLPTGAEKKRVATTIRQTVHQEIPPNVEDWQRLHALMQLEGERLRLSTNSRNNT